MFQDFEIYKIIFSKDDPIFVVLKHIFIFKPISKRSHESNNPEIMEMLGFGLSRKQIEKL